MADSAREERLAALAARRGTAGSASTPAASTSNRATRVVATGTSVVSFAGMVLAMGPLTAGAEEALPTEEPLDDTQLGPLLIEPPSPEVVIEVVPNYVTPDGAPLQAAALDALGAAGAPPTDSVEADASTQPLDAGQEPVQPASTEPVAALPTGAATAPSEDVANNGDSALAIADSSATNAATPAASTEGQAAGGAAVSTTLPPAAATQDAAAQAPAPTTTATPAPTAAPTTAAPITVPVTTAAPITVPPTTAPPPTTPPTTAPPKSEGS